MSKRMQKRLAGLAVLGILPCIAVLPVAAQNGTTPAAKPAAPAAKPVDKPATAPAKPAEQPAPAAAPAHTPIPANVTVAATVNGDKILMADINAAAKRIEEVQPGIPVADMDAIKREICEDLIAERLLVQEAKRMNLMPEKQLVDDAIWRFQKPFLSQAEYLKHLKEVGKTEEDLRNMLAAEMGITALSKKLTEDITVSDEEIAKIYNEQKANFVVPEMVHVRHIQISVKSDASADEKAKAKKRAEEALKKAVNPNADFAALAKEYSDDKVSAGAAGDLGFVARDDVMDKAFGDAAFTAATGKVHNKLVETKFGYNIIKVESKKPSRTLELSEVSSYIKPRILQNKLKERLDTRVAELRKSADIKKNI